MKYIIARLIAFESFKNLEIKLDGIVIICDSEEFHKDEKKIRSLASKLSKKLELDYYIHITK